MNTLEYILNKYGIILDDHKRMPIEIPNVGRDTLAALFHELGFTVGAEIGVEQGVYAEILCKNNPQLLLYGIDAWKAYKGYRDHTTNTKLQRFYETTVERLKPYNTELIREFSMDAVHKFEDNSLDFVYIDANHDFQNVTNDVHMWLKKIKVGGIIAGHDYAKYSKPTNMHVAEAVNGYTEAYGIRPWFLLGTNAIIPGEIRDSSRSWFWIKTEFPSHRGNHRD